MRRLSMLLLTFALLPACDPTFTRASEDPSIDDAALSTRLDRTDLDEALEAWLAGFESSSFYRLATGGEAKPNIAILRIANDTSEHIGSALDNLLNSAETQLVQSGRFKVIDNTTITRDAIMAERLRNLGDSVDPETIAALGKEYGIHYFVNGRVGDTAEKTGDTKRVQYYLFMRVTDVATGVIEYQHQIDITKQLDD